MLKTIHKMCGHKCCFYEPYAASLYLFHLRDFCVKPSIVNAQKLPMLPVPKLTDTLNKYLKTIKPFLNEEEYIVTQSIVRDFGDQKGIGQKLQLLLEKKAESCTNWLEDWWLNTAYLEYRNPVVVYSSPGLVFPFRKFSNQADQLHYTAKTLLAVLDYKLMIDSDAIPVEMMGKNPLDMGQYKKIFGTCRIPDEKRDKLSFNDSKYVTVFHNNHIFHMDLWGDDNIVLDEEQIVKNLSEIIKLSEQPAPNPVGVLTSNNRDEWAKAYKKLSEDNTNKAHLKDIEQSLAVVCLDAPVGLWKCADKDGRQNLAAAQTIHGGGSSANGCNRWYDKTVQFIIGADGVTGLTYEHSPAEGQPIAVLTDYIINYIDKGEKCSKKGSSKPKKPIQLIFNVHSEIKEMINSAKDNLDKLMNDLELNCFTYSEYGKEFIKSQKISPDSYLQMAMQYAFYKLHNTPGAHYESAATRMYIGGRTETIRSCSVESVTFAKTMLDPNSSPKNKMTAMLNAIKAHKDYTVQALQGYGVDRHLLGLKLIALENNFEIPKLYSDPGFTRSAHMRLSTSQVACRCDGFMCYGPLVADGYATCYNPRARDVNFATAAWRSDPTTAVAGYREALTHALKHMHDVLLMNTQSKL